MARPRRRALASRTFFARLTRRARSHRGGVPSSVRSSVRRVSRPGRLRGLSSRLGAPPTTSTTTCDGQTTALARRARHAAVHRQAPLRERSALGRRRRRERAAARDVRQVGPDGLREHRLQAGGLGRPRALHVRVRRHSARSAPPPPPGWPEMCTPRRSDQKYRATRHVGRLRRARCGSVPRPPPSAASRNTRARVVATRMRPLSVNAL